MILTSDSQIDKGFCLRHCVLGVLKQSYTDYEIIIIDNSHDANSHEVIKKTINEILQQQGSSVDVHIVKPVKPLSRGAGRNFGASFCHGAYIVFLDDDAIVISNDAFLQIEHYTKKYDFGAGAKRLRTNPLGRFNKNADIIFEKMLGGKGFPMNHIGTIPAKIRCGTDTILKDISFIGHFGFCKRSLFEELGGFPDFPGCDYEDDYFMYKCIKSGSKYINLDDIAVIHISHPLSQNSCSNILRYHNLLKSEGVFRFHVSKMFENNNLKYNEIIESLHEYHPDDRVTAGYKTYRKILTMQKKLPRSIEYGIQDYCILLHKILHNGFLNDFVKSSNADFDNLIPIINSFMDSHLISFHRLGKIEDLFHFKNFPQYDIQKNHHITPKTQFNQFPCDQESRQKRYDLIRERYPFTDYIRVAILGDDDLVSTLLGRESRIDIDVVEVDPQITKIIEQAKLPNIKIFNQDLRKKQKTINTIVKTFIIDPPYTKNGILLFIYKGLQLLNLTSQETQEFYVIVNQSMVDGFIDKVQRILSLCGIWIHEIRPQFSYYDLPPSYAEHDRAMVFLDENVLPHQSLTYSSSSSLYIFRTNKPEIDLLWKNIDISHIYNHDVF